MATNDKRKTVSVSSTAKKALDKLAIETGQSLTNTLDYVLSSFSFRTELQGAAKAEYELKKLLFTKDYGHRKLGASLLRDITGVNLDICKKVCGLYESEILAANEK
jgi:hypothetical protein